jgi:hypothetical protein
MRSTTLPGPDEFREDEVETLWSDQLDWHGPSNVVEVKTLTVTIARRRINRRMAGSKLDGNDNLDPDPAEEPHCQTSPA